MLVFFWFYEILIERNFVGVWGLGFFVIKLKFDFLWYS